VVGAKLELWPQRCRGSFAQEKHIATGHMDSIDHYFLSWARNVAKIIDHIFIGKIHLMVYHAIGDQYQYHSFQEERKTEE
jgi:hypothetical protein